MATIEIDGKTLDVDNGKMIIEVADEAGIHIPRFCYHKKLSIAANCRMCLVEVENGRKPVPACATPITDGMKVFTKSEEAKRSQKAVMEFLLINHPLDCPICDQGGECELQDVSMGFGEGVSEYTESKRAVDNDNLGALVETEMTRCIHCTRCVRFGDEIAGVRELGATGRGEHMEIGTYVKHSLKSEVSGNIIDLCPVGALTSKPFRYTARAWELTQHESIAPHDCIGSNVFLHVRRNELMRTVPKENDDINENWLSDRDRFSYTGINSKFRAKKPMIKRNGQWEEVDWQTALEVTADGIAKVIKKHGEDQFAAFSSSSATLEEMFLLQKLMRSLGVKNLDHRLQQSDFRDQDNQPMMPKNDVAIKEIESASNVLLVGANIMREVPLLGVRVRKAFVNGALINVISAVDYDYPFDINKKAIVVPDAIALELAKIVKVLTEDVVDLDDSIKKLFIDIEPDANAKNFAKALTKANSLIITGALCENHPDSSIIRTLLNLIERFSKARVLRITTGANTAGAWLSGMVPHRKSTGIMLDSPGLNVDDALDAKLKGYFLHNVEPGYDFANPARTRNTLLAAEFVAVTSSFDTKSIREYADVILPIAQFAETSGTFINVEHKFQSFKGALKPAGDARPAWKVFRVLGNMLECSGFEYVSSEDVLQEIALEHKLAAKIKPTLFIPNSLPKVTSGIFRMGEWPLYRSDALVRFALPLQEVSHADITCVCVNPETAKRLKLNDTATVSQGDIEITLPLKRDERIAQDVIWVANAMPETVDLGAAYAAITIKR